jgi:hypothetical protein
VPNTGTVSVDNPERRVPKTHQVSAGYERQVGDNTTAGVDYIRVIARDQFVSRDLNPGLRATTTRTGPIVRVDPRFGSSVLQPHNLGRIDHDALAVRVHHRPGRLFSARLSYTWSHTRGNTSGNGAPQVLLQQLDDLRLDANQGPTDFDRRHNFVAAGTAIVPGTGGLMVSAIARAMSGLPFTLTDSNSDADRNGILFDILPPGDYSGSGRNAITVNHRGTRNGAYGPGFFQLDLRLSYRRPAGAERTFELFGEVFNVTDRANFDNPAATVLGHPVADRRLSDFLVLRAMRPGAIPRTGQVGARFSFD